VMRCWQRVPVRIALAHVRRTIRGEPVALTRRTAGSARGIETGRGQPRNRAPCLLGGNQDHLQDEPVQTSLSGCVRASRRALHLPADGPPKYCRFRFMRFDHPRGVREDHMAQRPSHRGRRRCHRARCAGVDVVSHARLGHLGAARTPG
jgi:hypothetical protein